MCIRDSCILHTFADTAEKLHAAALHLSMDGLRKLDHQQRKKLSVLGASCHSAAEASEAEALGCTYITAGHIFNTYCKAGVPGRGTDFLKDVYKRQLLYIPPYGAEVDAVRRRYAEQATYENMQRCRHGGTPPAVSSFSGIPPLLW